MRFSRSAPPILQLGLLLMLVGLALMLLTTYGAAGVFLLIVGVVFVVVGL